MPTQEDLDGIMESIREVVRKNPHSMPSTPTQTKAILARQSQSPCFSPKSRRVTKPDDRKLSRASLMERIRQVKDKDYKRKTATPASPALPANKSTYTPWSREDFIERVASYQYRYFTVDSSTYPKLSPYNTARYGWECVTKTQNTNMLQCVTCKSFLAICVPDEDSDNGPSFYQAVEDKYVALLTDNHTLRCLWRSKPCQESIGSIITALPQLRGDLDALQSSIPDELVSSLAVTIEGAEKDPKEPCGDRALLIATGWRFQPSGLLKCHLCSRVAHPKDTFDAIQEHRDWCPYAIEKSEDGEPAWRQVLQKPTRKECSKERLSHLREVFFGQGA